MYATYLRKPSDETYVMHRLINDQDPGGPMTAQMTDVTQQIMLTLMCATQADVVRAKRYLQDLDQCFHVTDNTAPVQEGLNLFAGTLTGTRYLPIGERDDGEYTVNFSL